MRLFIWAPDIFPGDAVGNHCFGVARVARRLGYEVSLHAQHHAGDLASIDTLCDAMTGDDTLWLSYSIHDPLLERLLALPGKKLCYFHGVTSPEMLREFEPVTADLCAKSIEQFPQLAGFDLLLANSRFTASSLPPQIPPERVRILPPVSADMAVFRHTSPRRADRSADAPFVLLVVGRVVPHKRIEDAIDIVAGVRERGVDARLQVIGTAPNGQYAGFLVERATSLGVAPFVEFAGMVDDANLFDRFDRADALLVVSRHEGFCVPVLEAMHLGLPTFVRDGTAASEVGADASVVFQTLPQAVEAIATMAANPVLATCAVAAGRQRAVALLDETRDEVFRAILGAAR
ncbi:glycosyltransferase [Burkholderia glumae]|uniref:glycosyltransferase family 4 protein n=1 Tax=Burkholderia glumae TaxID=337 RepID=UPI000F5DB3D8|nr:glycosyltransferase family 4 protein [Burkholderia glumae]MCQ0029453.1 glycosyltransferase family 4 protein [Burkholderia glumae]MCQ0035911.1 glycosyltransferase family 4 protein [Burkholderia glumae]QJW78409.1 glycosyltransferase family 4 protein [Burkholderia glumae]RQZ73713.1 glycosyltransferase [Burkholderia glumae]UVS83520.1 glycosyltransferase [Burkholderia glumae]